MATATAAVVEKPLLSTHQSVIHPPDLPSTCAQLSGARKAIKSERFIEWQRELCSSRAIHSGRKRHEETDMETVTGMKKTFVKSDEDIAKPQLQQESEERDAEGEEPAADSVVGEGNGSIHRIKRQKQLHQRQRSDVKKLRKEHEVDHRRLTVVHSKEKSPPPTEGDGGRMRKCKQQTGPPLQASLPKRPVQPVTLVQQEPDTSLSQPISKRRQRRVPGSTSPQKEEKDLERALRSLTRTRGGETFPTAPPVPAGKGTKRSKRVSIRLANEEPPAPPLKLPKLQVVLTRKEIQDDWIKITGHKYTGKPKKSTIVQRGLGLCTALTCPSSIRYLTEPQ